MTIYVNVDSPNLGFPYFNFIGEAQCKKNTLYKSIYIGEVQVQKFLVLF